jgi:hypothetical protein
MSKIKVQFTEPKFYGKCECINIIFYRPMWEHDHTALNKLGNISFWNQLQRFRSNIACSRISVCECLQCFNNHSKIRKGFAASDYDEFLGCRLQKEEQIKLI